MSRILSQTVREVFAIHNHALGSVGRVGKRQRKRGVFVSLLFEIKEGFPQRPPSLDSPSGVGMEGTGQSG